MSFRYPDTGDTITAAFIRDNEPYKGYWQESEEEALAFAGKKLGTKQANKALDAGCGEGRLLPWLGQYAAEVTAIEPDKVRLAVASERNKTVECLPHRIADHNGSYDLILCSHIIQHLPTREVLPTLAQLFNLTAPGGNLILMYSQMATRDERFSLESLQNDKVVSRKVNQAAFDASFATAEADGILPVHYFEPDELRSQAENIGWQETSRWAFHVMEKEIFKGKKIPDNLINKQGKAWQKFGFDMLVIWHREK